jgi:ATP-dependent DNA helicase RecQ
VPAHDPAAAGNGGSGAASATGSDLALDQPLFERLRAWRAEVARAQGVPAFVVFHDQTLRAIAQSNARALEDLGAISGIGARKLANYGPAVLQLLDRGAA